MTIARANCSGFAVTINFDSKNESFSQFLIFGLDFIELEPNKFEKIAFSKNELEKIVFEIYSEARSSNVELILDRSLSALLKEVENEKQILAESLKKGREIKLREIFFPQLPKEFYRIPKKFQYRSINHLISTRNTANFSVPGSGKTTISLAAYAYLKNKGLVEGLFVVGPLSSFLSWEEEFQECFGRPAISARISGSQQNRILLYDASKKFDLFLISYHMLKFEESNIERLLQRKKLFLILDESHHIKNFKEGLHSSIVRRLAKYAARRLILSGTPAPNSIEDLWSQFTFLWPQEKLLGTKAAFKVECARNISNIKRKIDPLFIRITKDELNIPKPIIQKVNIKLHPLHYDFYYQLCKSASTRVKKISDISNKKDFFKLCTAWLIQAIDDPSRLIQNANFQRFMRKDLDLLGAYHDYEKGARPMKIVYSKKVVEKLIKRKQKVLFWSYFVNNIKGLAENEFHKFNPLLLYGDIPKDASIDEEVNREKNIKLFKHNPQRRLLIANPAACAESISLHNVCKNAIYLDRTLNCAQYLQSMDRIHRLGIKSSPHIDLYIAKETFDERVDERLTEKTALMYRLLDDPFAPINLETTEEDYFGEVNERMKLEVEIDLALVEEELKGKRR